jgi:hypothetical protein
MDNLYESTKVDFVPLLPRLQSPVLQIHAGKLHSCAEPYRHRQFTKNSSCKEY